MEGETRGTRRGSTTGDTVRDHSDALSASAAAATGVRASRRAVLGGVAAGATLLPGAAVLAGADPAEAAGRYKVRRFRRVKTPNAATRHLVSRFTYGWTPKLQKEITKAGGFQRWFAIQLDPDSGKGVSDAFYRRSSTWWTSINASPETIWERSERDIEPWWKADENYQRWALVRRIHSKRQVQEVMAEFFEHHLHVPTSGEETPMFRASYGKVVRSHALGKFSDLLHAAITHPAMGVHLDNAVSTKRGINENLGRELLELFTVGTGNFTESDVKNSAAILTGYRVDVWDTWRVFYEPDDHVTGAVKVLGFRDANRSKDGREVTRRYLRYLARHPKTAETIARKLAIRFVSDTPSDALVTRLAQVYLDRDTAIAPVLKALSVHPEFKRAKGRKVRTGPDDIVATYRALGVKVRRPTADNSGVNQLLWQAGHLGELPLSWPRPDGMPDTATAWSSTSRFLASLEMHQAVAGGWWPKKGMKHRSHRAWLPIRAAGAKKKRKKNKKKTSIRFDQLVDHLSRSLLGRPSTPRLLQAACEATGWRPGERITTRHPLAKWGMTYLLVVFLDSPDHMTR